LVAGNTISRALLCFAIVYVIEWRLQEKKNGYRYENRPHPVLWADIIPNHGICIERGIIDCFDLNIISFAYCSYSERFNFFRFDSQPDIQLPLSIDITWR